MMTETTKAAVIDALLETAWQRDLIDTGARHPEFGRWELDGDSLKFLNPDCTGEEKLMIELPFKKLRTIKMLSDVSGDHVGTKFGRLSHTNGYAMIWANNRPVFEFWLRDLPAAVGRQIASGDAENCSVAVFSIPALEAWIESQPARVWKI